MPMCRFKIVLSIIVLAFFSSCKHEPAEKVLESFDNGKPSKVRVYSSASDTTNPLKEILYYKDGQTKMEGGLKDSKRNGVWIYYHPNGKKWSEGTFVNGLSEGEFTIWDESGKIAYKALYKEGKPDGKWLFYDLNGRVAKEAVFDNGKKISETML
jgi:antitoxin component YwqK of YwqJK toxin-antitoxin module